MNGKTILRSIGTKLQGYAGSGMAAVMIKYVVPVLRFCSLHKVWDGLRGTKRCGPVPGTNSLDAERGGCAMLIESLKTWRWKWKVILESWVIIV